MLFTNDVALARQAEAAGIDRIVIDLERRGKTQRQHGYHLECNWHTVDELARMKSSVSIPVLCRVNPLHEGSAQEIHAVIAAGADIVMLPMFREARDVTAFLSLVSGRARTSLLFETREAVALASALDPGGCDEVYVGLNDLALSYGARFCYELLADGVVDRLRARFPNKPFGFGGVTVLDGGTPLATRLILMEMARLRCTHVIVRRAFKRDVQDRDLAREVRRLRASYQQCSHRSPAETEAGRRMVHTAILAVAAAQAHAALPGYGDQAQRVVAT